MAEQDGAPAGPRSADTAAYYSQARNWLLTLPVGLLLLAVIFFNTGSFIHAQLLSLGGQIWDGYTYLRVDMAKPSCDPDPNIDKLVRKKVANAQSAGGALLEMGSVDPSAIRQSLLAKRAACREAFARYRRNQAFRDSLGLAIYVSVEKTIGAVVNWGQQYLAQMFILLLFFGALAALLTDQQIALRFSRTRLDYRFSAAGQLGVQVMMAYSAWSWMQIDGIGRGGLNLFWFLAFVVLALASAWRLVRLPAAAQARGNVGHALLAVPLYCWLGLAAAIYFFGVETYPAGPVVQLAKMLSFANLYTAIGLYVWVGMMLRHTRLAELIFDFLNAFRLAPTLILMLVVVGAAWPTAYTGASGIFVLAMGAVIYYELYVAGNRRQISVAATAMSGSMGVVLSPCLLVVIIAALNGEVTTNQLYGWGLYVYLLSAAVFCIAVLLTTRGAPKTQRQRPESEGIVATLVPLVPYVLIGAAVILIYTRLIGVTFTAFTAPIILPVAVLFLLGYDRWRARRRRSVESEKRQPPAGFGNAVRAATADSSVLLGGLLMLMVLSVIFGGVADRSGVMNLFSEDLGNVWLAMTIVVVIMVIVGMLIEPYGAVIMVSATMAPVAYANGINPVHFWLTVLVAFELGYLTPPVALNRLLTRQVVGMEEIDRAHAEVADHPSFWRRHESLLLPMVVMGISLLLVAYVPLMVMQWN